MKNHTRRVLKRTCATTLGIVMALASPLGVLGDAQATNTNYELIDNMQDAAILHCWNWSYETIQDNLELIAQCGYSAVQTSPATQPKDYTYEGEVGMEVGYPGKGGSGNWWKLYQPVAECVCDNGETWLGTKAELESLCAEAEKYGIKVLVDIVANHMGNITGWQNSLDDVSPQVGTYWNPEMLTDESYWHINDYQIWMSDSRLHFTQGSMGMPDLNTADKRVQKDISDLLVELIDCGVDGFRFDAAKHIETPDDDPAFASDFWPTVLDRAESHYTEVTGGDLYVYGEILNTVGDNFSIDSYTKYMSVTDNSAGNQLRESFRNNNLGTLNMNYVSDKSVIWAESHDTYMNESSRYASDKSIVRTWAMVGNKDNAASLFFVRPYYSKDTLNNDVDGSFNDNFSTTVAPAIMGNCETYTWASKEVAAINHFNNRMSGCSDYMGTDGNVAYCVRGEGIILVNFNGAGCISMSAHGVPDGIYTDEVSGNNFTVQNGNVSGEITSEYGIAVIYKNPVGLGEITYPVQLQCNVADGTVFYTDTVEVEITAANADSASYTATTGERGNFTGSKILTLGKNLSVGESVTLTVQGTNDKGTKTATYTFTKDEYDLSDCIFFKNSNGWSTVTAYMWNDEGATVVNNAGWPGETMFECDTDENIYSLKIDGDYNKVIFSNNGSSQTADLDCGEIGYLYNPTNDTWTQYYAEEEESETEVETKTEEESETEVETETEKETETEVETETEEESETEVETETEEETETEVETETEEETETEQETETVVEKIEALFIQVSNCSWFGNDNAVLAVKCNTQDAFEVCESVEYDGTTYYKLEVSDDVTSVTLCRMLSSGATYNEVNVDLMDGKNVWIANAGFNGGDWTYYADLDEEAEEESTEEEKNYMTVYFVNNYNWSDTIKAYYWGSALETVSWPGVDMTYMSEDTNGNSMYQLSIPTDITGLIFTNGSEQTVDITSDLTDHTLFAVNGNSGNRYTVSASMY